jgi:hypothetical protein
MKLQIILIPKLFISLLIYYKYKQINPLRQPGGFSPNFFPKIFLEFSNKNTHKVFFTHTLRLRDYPPILGIKGGRGVGRIRPPIIGEGYRGVFSGRGITKTP